MSTSPDISEQLLLSSRNRNFDAVLRCMSEFWMINSSFLAWAGQHLSFPLTNHKA